MMISRTLFRSYITITGTCCVVLLMVGCQTTPSSVGASTQPSGTKVETSTGVVTQGSITKAPSDEKKSSQPGVYMNENIDNVDDDF